MYLQSGRSKTSVASSSASAVSVRSAGGSDASSPDVTSRAAGPRPPMHDHSDDSSLNSVDLDPLGKLWAPSTFDRTIRFGLARVCKRVLNKITSIFFISKVVMGSILVITFDSPSFAV